MIRSYYYHIIVSKHIIICVFQMFLKCFSIIIINSLLGNDVWFKFYRTYIFEIYSSGMSFIRTNNE